MKVVNARAFPGPNVFAPVPIVRLAIDFEDLSGRSPVSLGPAFAENLRKLLPELDAGNGFGGVEEIFSATALLRDDSFRLGHVVAAAALAIQRIAGAEVSHFAVFAGADEAPTMQEVRYAFWESEVGIASGLAAAHAVAQLADLSVRSNHAQVPPRNLAGFRRNLLSPVLERSLDISTAALVREAIRRGIPWRRLNERDNYVQFGHGRFQKRIHETKTSHTSGIAAWLSGDKNVTNRLLFEIGVPVPQQAVVRLSADVNEAAGAVVGVARKQGFPVVVKPLNRGKGLGVGVNLRDEDSVRKAVLEASKYSRLVIVESFIAGDDHRILVVGGKMVAAAKRIPGHVVGNGRQSVAQLVEEANRDPRRGTGYRNLLTFIELDAQAERVLSEQGLAPGSVPTAGQVVYLRYTANISTGGTAVDVTDAIHPDNARAAVRAAMALGLDVAGVDFITTDIARSYKEIGGAICEVNVSPGLRPHWLADGRRDVVGPILDTFYPPGAPARVPIAAITGTNGKTTTTRMVARILEHAGHVVGFACTDGAYVDGELVIEGDVAGPTGARAVLLSPDIDAAVLETSRRGIITRGLAFDRCDVGAVLNVCDDHVGTDGIRDIDDLARIKGLVAEVARDTVVLNADDERCVAMATRGGAARVCYVTMSWGNERVASHIGSGGMAVTLRPDGRGPVIELHQDGAAADVLPAYDVPTVVGGKAMHNVQNAMFAAAIARALGTSLDHVRSGLRSLGCDHEDTPGRLDVFDRLPFPVVVDYAHNPQKFAAATAFIKQLDCTGRRIVAFTSPGNRTDPQIGKLAQTAAASGYDHYVCFRRDDRRGRGDTEVPELLRDGLLAEGIPPERISVIPSELQAIAAALEMAQRGDVVALLYTDHERTWKLLTDGSR